MKSNLEPDREVLHTKREEDELLIAALTPEEALLFRKIVERKEDDTRSGQRNLGLDRDQLIDFVRHAESDTVAKVAFEIWVGNIYLSAHEFDRYAPGETQLRSIIAFSGRVRELALQALFTGQVEPAEGRSRDVSQRMWLESYPDGVDQAFEGMAQMQLQGDMMVYLTEDVYRDHPYRLKAAEAALEWSLSWKWISGRARGGNSLMDRLDLLLQIRAEFPNFSEKVDGAVELFLEEGKKSLTFQDCDQYKYMDVESVMRCFNKIRLKYPQYEGQIWGLVSKFHTDGKIVGGNLNGANVRAYLSEKYMSDPAKIDQVLEIALRPPGARNMYDDSGNAKWNSTWILSEQLGLLTDIWTEFPKNRTRIVVGMGAWELGNIGYTKEMRGFLYRIWNDHPKDRQLLWPLMLGQHEHYAGELQLDQLVFETESSRSSLFKFSYDRQRNIAFASESYDYHHSNRLLIFEHFPKDRKALWQHVLSQQSYSDRDSGRFVDIMRVAPEMASQCITHIQGMLSRDREECALQSYHQEEDFHKRYTQLIDLIEGEQADRYPKNQIVRYVVEALCDPAMEPTLHSNDWYKITHWLQVLCLRIVQSEVVEISNRKRVWEIVSMKYNRLGYRSWDHIWEIAESDTPFRTEAVEMLYAARDGEKLSYWMRLFPHCDEVQRGVLVGAIAADPALNQKQIRKILDEYPEYEIHFRGRQLPGIEDLFEMLKGGFGAGPVELKGVS